MQGSGVEGGRDDARAAERKGREGNGGEKDLSPSRQRHRGERTERVDVRTTDYLFCLKIY